MEAAKIRFSKNIFCLVAKRQLSLLLKPTNMKKIFKTFLWLSCIALGLSFANVGGCGASRIYAETITIAGTDTTSILADTVVTNPELTDTDIGFFTDIIGQVTGLFTEGIIPQNAQGWVALVLSIITIAWVVYKFGKGRWWKKY